ncbi:MAG: accessory gene regulator B family protein [Syntrophothermus sp.]|uniref:accessory gene regulator ArgB-like protein n=1 Tax=Syntrophothermus sp. TaxID=2736299 RepID=UPI002580D510|nr:accessory gene regulator B family protein [Syntrophothermus sp.]NSW81945.1 accessory gene regulator B family protein [Syntrophothermus sp.]
MRPLMVRLAARLAQQTGTPCDLQLVAYGLEILVDGIIQVLAILILALILGVLKPVALVMTVAMVYRRFSGGVHCTGFYRCMTTSAVVFLGLGYLAIQLAATNYVYVFQGFAVIASSFAAAKWAPGDNPVKPITTEAKKSELKQKSLLTVVGVALIALANWYWSLFSPLTLTAITLGLLWQSFTITPWGYRLIGWVDRILTGVRVPERGGE